MNDLKFYYDESEYNKVSPSIILPIVKEIFDFESVLDVGCGIGTWLAVSKDLGVKDFIGIDSDLNDKSKLFSNIYPSNFLPIDLEIVFNLNRKFDIVFCLEVVEHIDPKFSDDIVLSLISHSEVILFSAAIPYQDGFGHVNEQWPYYWAEKFKKYDYNFLDIIRPKIWNDPRINFWYKQNIFLVVKGSNALFNKYSSNNLALVHPELFEKVVLKYQSKINQLEKQLKSSPLRRLIRRIFKWK